MSATCDTGEQHAFNAVLVGDTATNWDDWLFIEPQSDSLSPMGIPPRDYFETVRGFSIYRSAVDSTGYGKIYLFSGARDRIVDMRQPLADSFGYKIPSTRSDGVTIDRVIEEQMLPRGVSFTE